MSRIRILSTEILSQTKYRLEKVTYTFSGHDGKERVQKREVYQRGSSAAILLYDSNRKTILLGSQIRLPAYLNNDSPQLLEACAGMIEKDESPEQCILREAEEEMGYRISEIEKIAEAYTSPGAIIEYTYFFLGKYSPDMKISEGGGKEEEGEDIAILELTYDEAKHKLDAGKIRDAKTVILLQYAILKGII
ncbi:MAG TPA: GDP-mannose pyrophosphatase [Sphingobacteriaceae bacterium]|nr:GDP-mannose pyrophosphatase [Sphingobacteriaceae bacterium]